MSQLSHATRSELYYDHLHHHNLRVRTGIEVFKEQILKLLTKLANVWILRVFSMRCFHQWGKAKMIPRELQTWLKPEDFRWRTWVHAGLPFKIQNVEEIIGRFHSSVVSLNRSHHQSRVGTFRGELMPPSQKLLTRVMTRLLISDPEKAHSITTKGNLPCIKNYS